MEKFNLLILRFREFGSTFIIDKQTKKVESYVTKVSKMSKWMTEDIDKNPNVNNETRQAISQVESLYKVYDNELKIRYNQVKAHSGDESQLASIQNQIIQNQVDLENKIFQVLNDKGISLSDFQINCLNFSREVGVSSTTRTTTLIEEIQRREELKREIAQEERRVGSLVEDFGNPNTEPMDHTGCDD